MANGIFNAEQYLELYPALVEAGITVDTAWDHYATYGAGELRAPNAELDGKVYAASVLNYANANADVAEYFGIEVPATSLTQEQAGNVMLQYVLFGYDEERDAKIVDAPVERDDSDTVAAINDYQDAKAAETAAIKEAAKELDTEETKGAVEAAVNTAASALSVDEEAEGAEAYQIPNFDNEDLTPAVRDQLLKAKEDTLKADLAAQENLQGKALGAAKALGNAESRLDTAYTNRETANEKLTATAAAAAVYVGDTGFNAEDPVNLTNFAIGSVTLKYNNGKVDLEGEPGDKAKLEKASNYKELEAAFIAANKAEEKVGTAQENVGTAVDNYNKQKPDAVSFNPEGDDENPEVVVDESSPYYWYQQAHNNLDQFNKLSADYKAAAAQLAKVDAAGKDVAAAVEVLEDMGYEVVLDEFATEGDDLFIYSEGANSEYYFDFGAEGEDAFFFGTQFSFVELAAGDDIAKGDFGDKNAFEVFAQQDGNDVVLYVETNEVGGTATGTEDLDTITLVGVDLADLQWDGGFLFA